MLLSVIIPTYNEEFRRATITKTLDALSRAFRSMLTILCHNRVVDGGSADRTVELVQNHAQLKKLHLVKFPEANRGKQFHEGTRYALGEIYWFLPADTRSPRAGLRQANQTIYAL